MTDILDAINAARAELGPLPPKIEIWSTEMMPATDAKGDPVISRWNVKQMADRLNVIKDMPPQKIQTVTDADEVIMLHPSTLLLIERHIGMSTVSHGLAGIPVFDDEYRRAVFQRRKR